MVSGSVTANYAYNFIYNGGSFTAIATPNAGSGANEINDTGQIVGIFSDRTGTHGFLDMDGTFTTIDDPGATRSPGNGDTDTEPDGINNAGQVVGFDLGPGYWNGFLETNGSFTAVTDPSAFFNGGSLSPGTISGGGTFPTGINNLGQIVGYYLNAPGTSFGFLDTNGTFNPVIDPLAAGFGTSANGINDSGAIVGDYTPAGNPDQDGFVDIDDVFTMIAVPGAIQTQVRGINNLGTIVGQWVDGSNHTHAFIGVPTAQGATSYAFTTIDAPDTVGQLISPVPCFRTGTRLATTRGDVPVEFLRVGDRVQTISGRTQPVEWIGRRSVDCRRHVAPERVKPIRIAPHSFGENRPKRALFLSPDHSVFVEDVLIPIKFLVNHSTIYQIDASAVTYYHFELPRHDVVLAEGLPTETYLETGGRFAFEHDGGAIQMYPDFTPDEAQVGMLWQELGYAPLIGTDGQFDRVCARLAAQAFMLGYQANSEPRRRARRHALR